MLPLIAVDLLSEMSNRDFPELCSSSWKSSHTAAIMESRKYHALLFSLTKLKMCLAVLVELGGQSAPLLSFLSFSLSPMVHILSLDAAQCHVV